MALVLADRVQQTGTANTTVSFTLSGSVTGFQSFAVIGNTNTTYYSATDTTGNWEVGIGTYSTTGPTLTRTTILSSSNSGSAVTFSGTITVFATYPAEKSVNQDASNNVTGYAISGGTIDNTVIGGTTPAAGTFSTLNLTNPLSLTNGGTGKTTATAAIANLQGYATTATVSFATTAASGDGTTATLTFATQASAPFAVGSTIFVAGVTPAGYNTATGALVTACTTSTVSYLNATTGAQTVAGTVTAAPVLTNTSSYYQVFTGTTIGAVILPVASTVQLGWVYKIYNASTGGLTVYSSGGNSILALTPSAGGTFVCIDTTLTTAAAWRPSLSDFGTLTGSAGSVVLNVSPTISGTLNFTGSTGSTASFGTSVTNGPVNIATSQTTGAYTLGSTTGTAVITLGRSTGSQYIDIANGATTTSTVASGTASSITTTVLTVGGTVTGTFVVGMQLTGTNVLPNTYITTLGTGTGGAGTYNISQTQTVASTTITGTTQKTINIGTNGVSGSLTNITLGSAVSGSAGTTTVNGYVNFTGPMLLSGSSGTSGQVLTSAGSAATPTWTTSSASPALTIELQQFYGGF